MFTSMTDTFTLSNGVKIPCLGYGTWQTPSGDICRESVKAALQAGYRHIDTAAGYANEADVGAGLRESGVAREDVFLTTKHWIMNRGYSKTIAAVEASLKELGTDYIDLYLVHWPCVEKSHPNWKEINAATWRGFEKMYKDGKIRALGVSNYLPEHILALEETAEIKPVVNQIEFHPGYYQPALVKWCQDHGMVVEGWSPLGCGAVLKDATIAKIAAKYGKSPAQICIRFALQSGVLPMPKSTHADRIADNARVFDFNLADEDMLAIQTMPPLGYSTYHPAEAPADSLFGGVYDLD
ncbi:MAG: aldo/keto reductase [Ruminococcaceae bacterium]|nr:aldo/keto reductase [Oscillospiraceae bacterium]